MLQHWSAILLWFKAFPMLYSTLYEKSKSQMTNAAMIYARQMGNVFHYLFWSDIAPKCSTNPRMVQMGLLGREPHLLCSDSHGHQRIWGSTVAVPNPTRWTYHWQCYLGCQVLKLKSTGLLKSNFHLFGSNRSFFCSVVNTTYSCTSWLDTSFESCCAVTLL